MAAPVQRGVITEAHPNAMFTVRLGDGRLVDSSLAGKLRTMYIRLQAGDTVLVELSPFDLSRGRIVRRDAAPGDDPGAAQRVLR
jgi:translation initiation factor IF-1